MNKDRIEGAAMPGAALLSGRARNVAELFGFPGEISTRLGSKWHRVEREMEP